MTRAADRLIVCGADGETKRPEGCWYDLVREPLKPFLVEEDGRRRKSSGAIARRRPVAAEPRAARPTPEKPERPEAAVLAARSRRPPKRRAPVPLSPSSAFDEEIGRASRQRRLRGRSAEGAGSAAGSCIG